MAQRHCLKILPVLSAQYVSSQTSHGTSKYLNYTYLYAHALSDTTISTSHFSAEISIVRKLCRCQWLGCQGPETYLELALASVGMVASSITLSPWNRELKRQVCFDHLTSCLILQLLIFDSPRSSHFRICL